MNREELVEEIAGYLLGAYELGHQDGTANDGRSQLTTKFLGHLSKELIARILQAIENGELKLPGEVGRVINNTDASMTGLDKVGDMFIILSPTGDEGREEEG